MMRYKFYTTSEKAWDAMLEAIKSARESIYLEMYIFLPNTATHNFWEAIKQKAREGLRVRIVLDSFGSSELGKDKITEIRGSGAELILFSRWLQYTHKKILIIDEQMAFLGGVNIHKVFQKWIDLQLRLEGRIVKSIIRSFAKTYKLCGGKDPKIIFYYEKSVLSRAKIWLLEHQGEKNIKNFKKHYQERISGAKKCVIFVTPYFFPRRWLVAALHQAILRGVEIEIVLPGKTNLWWATKANYFYAEWLFRLGAKIYIQKTMNHAKAMLVDDAEGLVGSQNLDFLSADYGVEVGVFFDNKEMVRDLQKIIETWKSDSDIFDSVKYKKTAIDKLFGVVLGLIRKII